MRAHAASMDYFKKPFRKLNLDRSREYNFESDRRLRVDMDDLAPRIQALRVAKEERTPEWTSEVNDALRAVRRFREQRSRAAEFAPESGGSSQLATEAGVV